jgi:hypothetical protein
MVIVLMGAIHVRESLVVRWVPTLSPAHFRVEVE